MKRTKKCPKCSSLRVGLLSSQPEISGEYHGTIARPAVVVALTRPGFWLTKPKPVTERAGTLEAYICTECGYHESYVVAPTEMPWNSVEHFTFLNPEVEEQGPYR